MKEITDGIFVETEYEGVNVGAIVTDEGIICVDVPSYPRDARDWAIRLERLHPRPIKLLILTDSNGDRILNTRWLNARIVAHHNVAEQLGSYEKRFPQSMLDSLIQRNAKYGKELSNGPVDRPALSFESDMSILYDNHRIVLRYMPGPTGGNIWVEIPDKAVLFTGDSLVVGVQPYVAEMYWQAWIDSLNQLAGQGRMQPMLIIPGRGDVANLDSIIRLKKYLQLIRSRVMTHVDNGGRRDELITFAEKLVYEYPPDHLTLDWVHYQVRLGLEHLYDELIALKIEEIDQQPHVSKVKSV